MDRYEHTSSAAQRWLGGTGGFFQIDRSIWLRACDCGLNAAVAYLVVASGSGADNRTTSWSVAAIERYTGMGRVRAKKAIKILIERGLITIAKGEHPQSPPRYTLLSAEDLLPRTKRRSEPDWIWLPNTLVTGVAGERPPIERVRLLHDVGLLKMFAELYHHQALADDGGIPWRLIRKVYARSLITKRGRWNVWGFREKGTVEIPNGVFRSGWSGDGDFWDGWNELRSTGLIECVPHLVEADTDAAAIIFPCAVEDDIDGTAIEKQIGMAASEAAAGLTGTAMLHRIEEYDFVLAVPDAYPKVELMGVYRLRYRAKTRAAAAWAAKELRYQEVVEGYRRLAEQAREGRPLNARIA